MEVLLLIQCAFNIAWNFSTRGALVRLAEKQSKCTCQKSTEGHVVLASCECRGCTNMQLPNLNQNITFKDDEQEESEEDEPKDSGEDVIQI